jgi:hypothetical protein
MESPEIKVIRTSGGGRDYESVINRILTVSAQLMRAHQKEK